MSDSEAKYNLLTGTRDWSGSWVHGNQWGKSGTHDGFVVMRKDTAWYGMYKRVVLTAGTTYTFSAMVRVPAGKSAHIYLSSGGTVNDTYLADSEFAGGRTTSWVTGDGGWFEIHLTFTPTASKAVLARIEANDSYTIEVCALMLVEGTTPAAWAPAEGETLAGGGAQMSTNLLEGVKPEITQYGSMTDGVITSSTPKDIWRDVAYWPITTGKFAENQTMHLGISAKWHGKAATTGVAYAAVKYADAAGSINNANIPISGITTEWKRFSLSAVIPSGMHLVDFHISGDHLDASYDAMSPVLSYGSAVCLASSAHTPYATQDHLRSEYATKAALKVTSDAVTAEVTERGKLAGRVGTLESTSGTHASKLQQLAASITSLVKGESTYTDPDGRSATSGIYSLVTQTRDSVTALFGSYTKTADMQSQIATAKSQATSAANSATDGKLASYTKTADLASTAAVKDAKKAGTDAASAASAAQSTANTAKSAASAAQSTADTAKSNAATAQSTADAAKSAASKAQSTADGAKSTADGLATLIRADSTGITVGKSEDGETWSTGRTRMTADAFEVLSKAGEVLSSFGKDKVRLGVNGAQIDMAGGRLLIDAQDHAASEMPSGLPTTIVRMICPSSNSGKNDTEMYLGAYDKDSGNVVGGMGITVTRETDGSYNTSVGISGSLSLGSATIATPLPVSSGGTGATSIDAARRNLHISQGSKVCHGHGTPWVTLFETWDEFQSATGCYDSGTPTLVTMNGDYGAFDGTLSGCEVKGGSPVYVLAQSTSGLPNLSSSQSVRINWICIW